MIRLLQRIIEVQDDELGRVGWSCGYFFFILAAYFIIRPLREEMGVAGGVRNLPWLFTGTLVAMLLIHPPFGALVARLPRRRFVALTYRFFTVNLLIFFALRHALAPDHQIWLGRVFFVWTSVFNLFVVSVFWGFMADIFTTTQGKRLFGFIGVGGTLGGFLGSTLTAELAPQIGLSNLLLVSAALLETGAFCARRLSLASARASRSGAPGHPAAGEETVIGGSAIAGVVHVLRSPYLLGICAYMLLFTIGSTVLYFQQAEFASAIADSAERTAFFARLEQAVQILTLLTQAFLTGRILKWLGVVGTLTLLPALSVVGFLALGTAHMLAVFVVFQVLRRAGEFAVAKPTREVLYTVVSREDKYKAKNLIDTFVYRAGDQVGAWSYTLIASVGVGVAGIALLAAPIAGLWLAVAFWLGRRHEAIRARPDFRAGELPAA
ncbi:MAG: NTP/NDP exchange transporter, partial [Gemmatimonadales bacterium]